MAWLRLYTDLKSDPKVHQLSANQFRTWIFCLLLAKENSGVLPPVSEIAFHLRVKSEVVETHLQRLQEVHLIDRKDNYLSPHNWNKRQFLSDDVTERVRKHREKEAKRFRNVSETPSDTDTDTDNPLPPSPARTSTPPGRLPVMPPDYRETIDRIYGRHPKKQGRILYEQALADVLGQTADQPGLMAKIEEAHLVWCDSDDWRKSSGQYAPKLANWIRDAGYLDWPPGYDPEYEAEIARQRKEQFEEHRRYAAQPAD